MSSKPAKISVKFKLSTKETGLRAVGAAPRTATIFLNGLDVGYIHAKQVEPHCYDRSTWTIRIQVPKEVTQQSPCPWKWVHSKQTFESRDAAKQWVRDNAQMIWEKVYKDYN